MSVEAAIVFTGGGTGGHIYPGLAVAAELRKTFRGRLVWLGSKKDSDRRAVEAAGLEFVAIPSGKLRRELSLENLVDVFRVVAGYFAARRALRQIRPMLVFSKGGYVSVPPCRAAADLGIPVFTHESDLTPGLATRLNAARADKVLVAWERTREAFPATVRPRVEVVGNPMRKAILEGDAGRGRALLRVPEGLPVVLAMGGSQGARQINRLILGALSELGGRVFVVHQTGEARAGSDDGRGAATDAGADGPPSPSSYRALPFIGEELPDIMAAADIVVSRAGAGALQEAAALGKPLILVPLAGSGTRGDQVDNAGLFEEAGAARVLLGETANSATLAATILAWLADPKAAREAGKAAAALVRTDSAARVARLILDRIGETP
ncbi:MAG TPA: undecaprenyldiphospho-muramoylpentapeptide beta-N-acetylglucosaminyltransferase [Rectinemataceae bacterium]|nr:undecaprenyldiphospho-muramoylpentapeptide beta-N-acetylglucosaminyltransferase [Rectinemataceae bacterium]